MLSLSLSSRPTLALCALESRSFDPDHMNPAYTLVDLMSSYADGPWTLSASVENLADRRVLTNCTQTVCTLGFGREIKVRAMYRW